MVKVNLTKFRQNTKTYFDAVEKGEVIQVVRHGKVIAEVSPPKKKIPSWKREFKPIEIPGVDIVKMIREERDSGL